MIALEIYIVTARELMKVDPVPFAFRFLRRYAKQVHKDEITPH
jgi:hypothetical protein